MPGGISPRPRSPISHGYYGQNTLGLGHPSGVLSRGRKSGLRSRATQLLGLRFGWVVLVIWYEVGQFFHSLSTCKFPDSQLLPAKSKSWRFRKAFPPGLDPTHLVLLADPHVPHPRLSYPPDSPAWLNWLRQAMDELFMRKSWNVVMRLGRVDGVIVLGDMLDWGRGVMTEQEYESYVHLFGSIFQLPASVPMYYIPGNHDIPIGPNKAFSSRARTRYERYFSPANGILSVANHSLIMLDAVGLVEEDYRRYAAEMQFGEWDGVEGGVIEFVKTIGDAPPLGPKILLSHIPLARPEKSQCGPYRESGVIAKGAGPGYQNLLGSETSRFLLEELEPSIVFSGDDHDYCDFTHPHGIREVTVKSFSSSAGVRRPGFHLLSLIPPQSSEPYSSIPTHADRPCFLPDQVGTLWNVYIPLGILTFLFLFGTNIWAAWERWTASGYSVYGELKARLSPSLMGSDTIPPTPPLRRASDRPSPLSMSRKSSSQYPAAMTPVAHYATSRAQPYSPTPRNLSSRSAPVSPTGSPAPSPRPVHRESFRQEDVENIAPDQVPYGHGQMGRALSFNNPNYHHSSADPYLTPALSTNNGYVPSSEPPSYFLPLPDGSRSSGVGLGLSTPTLSPNAMPLSAGLRRSTSANHLAGSTMPGMMASSPRGFTPTSASRIISPSDWSSAARAKEKSVFGLMIDSLPISSSSTLSKRRGSHSEKGLRMIISFISWLARARNGVFGKSWKELFAVAWPPAVTWVIINGLFFLG